ncbi:hypothetical protein [Jeongeupia chitinilytica]|uniref:Ribbon-helix-helix protein CopG domain-containing protein n=1 Tax=Jeongeupia chitinilytica TaxID=1041641 RepID=A0ABQ3H0F7_9NEIS|nr:hypothetical protein [Jeongeupia chitinilytica]GHD59796.1 hypothetical protein GCM10007350_11570 [Jeongeupia chitinilytica]
MTANSKKTSAFGQAKRAPKRVGLSLSTVDRAEMEKLAEAHGYSHSSFVLSMYRRGLQRFKWDIDHAVVVRDMPSANSGAAHMAGA